MSIPRVGSKQSIVWTPPATHRAMVTFCWLPPDSWRTSDAARVSIWSRSTAALTRVPSAAIADRAPRPDAGDVRQGHVLAHRPLHEQGLGAVRRHVDEAGPDGVGRMAERDRGAIDQELAPVGAARAGEHIEQLILALALERGDAEDFAGAQFERHVLESRADPQVANGESRCGGLGSGGCPRAAVSPAFGSLARSPSISATIRCSEPSLMSTTPTVAPSRRTVARSHTAAISIRRCEMKMMQRSDPR